MRNRDRILRAAVTALLLYAMGSLAKEYRLLCLAEARTEQLTAERERLAAERTLLEKRLERPPDERELRALAWERLGMAAPGEKIFYFVQRGADREETVWDWKLEALWKDG